MKAIETYYNGYKFRSRLEARWAVFFDAMGIRYQYELEGFEKDLDGGKKIMYLPDFYLPESGFYAEVKGASRRGQISKDDAFKISNMIDKGSPCEKGVLMLGYIPEPTGYDEMIWALWGYRRDGIAWSYLYSDYPSNKYDECELSCEYTGYYFEPDDDLSLTSSCGLFSEDGFQPNQSEVTKALAKARQARFEHGEYG